MREFKSDQPQLTEQQQAELNSLNLQLLEAAKQGNLEEAKRLLDGGAEVGAVDLRFNTALHLATELLGNTALDIAAKNRRTELARLLLERGAKVGEANCYNHTPLHIAAHFGYTELAQLLLERDADVEAVDREGNKPLHIAARFGRTETAQLLLERGADVEAVGAANYGRSTPLHLAAQHGHPELVQHFLEVGANTRALNFSGRTPLQAAQAKNHTEIAEILRAAESIPNFVATLKKLRQEFSKTNNQEAAGKLARRAVCYFAANPEGLKGFMNLQIASKSGFVPQSSNDHQLLGDQILGFLISVPGFSEEQNRIVLRALINYTKTTREQQVAGGVETGGERREYSDQKDPEERQTVSGAEPAEQKGESKSPQANPNSVTLPTTGVPLEGEEKKEIGRPK